MKHSIRILKIISIFVLGFISAYIFTSLRKSSPSPKTVTTADQKAAAGSPQKEEDREKEETKAGDESAASTMTEIHALGRLEPGRGVIKVSAPSDLRVYRLEVKEGQLVKAGDVLVYLESYPESLAQVDLARARLKNAGDRLAAEISCKEAVIKEARIHLKKIEMVGPLEIQAQEAKVRLFEAELTSLSRDLERLKILETKKSISRQEYDHQELLVQKTNEELSSAKVILAHLKAEQEYSLLEARAGLVTAEAELNKIKNEICLETMQKEIEGAQSRLSRSMVTAPISGRVLKILTWPGEVTGPSPILHLGDVANMYAVAEVYETDVQVIQPGQKAIVQSPALPEKLTGTVEEIGLMVFKNAVIGLDSGAAMDSRVIEVRIRLNDSLIAACYNHLQVDVEIDRKP